MVAYGYAVEVAGLHLYRDGNDLRGIFGPRLLDEGSEVLYIIVIAASNKTDR